MDENVTPVEAPEPKAPKKPKSKKANGKAEVKKVKAKAAKGSEKTKAAKPKTEKDQYGLRKDSARSAAAAMYARKNGATLEEVKDRVGSIQLNVLHELEAEGWTIEKAREERKGKRPITRYWLKPKA